METEHSTTNSKTAKKNQEKVGRQKQKQNNPDRLNMSEARKRKFDNLIDHKVNRAEEYCEYTIRGQI